MLIDRIETRDSYFDVLRSQFQSVLLSGDVSPQNLLAAWRVYADLRCEGGSLKEVQAHQAQARVECENITAWIDRRPILRENARLILESFRQRCVVCDETTGQPARLFGGMSRSEAQEAAYFCQKMEEVFTAESYSSR